VITKSPSDQRKKKRKGRVVEKPKWEGLHVREQGLDQNLISGGVVCTNEGEKEG